MRSLERLMKRASASRTRQLIRSELAPPIESNPTEMGIADPAMMDQLENLPEDLMAMDAASLDLFRDVVTNLGL